MPFIVFSIVLALVLLIVVVLVRTFRFSQPVEPVAQIECIEVDADAVAAHLSETIRCRTVSHGQDEPVEGKAFAELHQKLAELYPRVHAGLERQVIAEHSLLYTWKGSRPDLKPVLLMAHQDVVPVDPATLPAWEQLPFSGQIAGGADTSSPDKHAPYVWGRGCLDCKNQMVAELEAVEHLLGANWQPSRTLYLAFGHDEEVGGMGAKAIANRLKEQGIRLEAVIDEGGALMEGLLSGVAGPVALVGNGEKNYLTLELSVTGKPGHSATPPRHTAIGILARALTRLEANPVPAHVDAVRPLFQGVGGAASFVQRLAIANLWLLGGVVRRSMERSPTANATIRTTTAVTMISGGVKDNILPREAKAMVNFRLLPEDSKQDVVDHVRRVIDDERVQISEPRSFSARAAPVSPIDAPPYKQLSRVIRQIFGDIPVAPFLVIGATDARHYSAICENVYRFSPLWMTGEDLGCIHGIGERIGVQDLARMVQFFVRLVEVWAGEGDVKRQASGVKHQASAVN